MLSKSYQSKLRHTFNKYGYYLRWPRVWIIVLGSILVFLCLAIAGMELGNTLFDLYRSTAFGGFIVFIPLMLCAVCILITVYDIFVLIDPTRCFFLSCDAATVDVSNSTTTTIITGWPLYIAWPSYFQTNMNAKRIFQSIQILCAGLFILGVSLYILTYTIYRNIRLRQQAMYTTDHRPWSTYETNRVPSQIHFNDESPSTSHDKSDQKIVTYIIEGQPYTPTHYNYSSVKGAPVTSVKTTTSRKTFVVPRANSAKTTRLCTRCSQEPRMILTTNYQRRNCFPDLCINCNNDLVRSRRQPQVGQSKNIPIWRP
ncbi:unnamed protein product [Rotaria socialis]|uniref:Uncharacterized protein n=1 Tax=Rotaria socialis TaxID=392032 RepID=A0A818PW31_9BILA|nr:unnamed protein product [Rotaria socialis]CAF4097010.1 unnamed protein product [Rotaria socialis]